MTLPSNLKNEAEKEAIEHATYPGPDGDEHCVATKDDFLAGVQWLFNKLTKAPEGLKEFIQCPACGEEWSDDNWLPVAALASLEAKILQQANNNAHYIVEYGKLKSENAALSAESEAHKDIQKSLSRRIELIEKKNAELTSALEKIDRIQISEAPSDMHIGDKLRYIARQALKGAQDE